DQADREHARDPKLVAGVDPRSPPFLVEVFEPGDEHSAGAVSNQRSRLVVAAALQGEPAVRPRGIAGAVGIQVPEEESLVGIAQERCAGEYERASGTVGD